MRHSKTIAAFIVIAGLTGTTFSFAENIVNHAQAEATKNLIATKGVVKIIDTAEKKLTIAHEPIPSVSWPAMTMRFTYTDDAIIKDVKVNDTISFDFIQEGAVSVLQSITVNP